MILLYFLANKSGIPTKKADKENEVSNSILFAPLGLLGTYMGQRITLSLPPDSKCVTSVLYQKRFFR